MKQVLDNFSSGSNNYAAFRPLTPKSVIDEVVKLVPDRCLAWDCGTGNGQVAAMLSDVFEKVIGTDISQEQLDHAELRPNLEYRLERAEHTSLGNQSVDLITIAQAIHWFDFDHFYKEVNRVLKPGGIIAAWTYNLVHNTPELEAVVHRLFAEITGPYWDKERKWVDESYQTIPFPFTEIQIAPMTIQYEWTFDQLVGYLRTWSGVKHYMKKNGTDPLALVLPELKQAWGSADTILHTWPLHMRVGKIA